MANFWFTFITGLLKPFAKFRDDRLRLVAAIEADREARNQRFTETILDSQATMLKEMNATVAHSTDIVKSWLEGIQNLSNIKIQAPQTQTDTVQWKREQATHIDPDNIERYIREAIGEL